MREPGRRPADHRRGRKDGSEPGDSARERAADAAGVKMRVIGVSRFSSAPRPGNCWKKAESRRSAPTCSNQEHSPHLPDAPNVIHMAARKFGSTGDESYTWAMNAYLPARVAERYRGSRIVAFSSGNVYPLVPVAGRAVRPKTRRSSRWASTRCRRSARERLLDLLLGEERHADGDSAAELRGGDALRRAAGHRDAKCSSGSPVDLAMGNANVIWQGDANSICLRSFAHCSSPPFVLNLDRTGDAVGTTCGITIRRDLRRRARARWAWSRTRPC